MIIKVFSTSYLSGKGGISNVIYGYYESLVQAGNIVELIETHSPNKFLRQINPFVFELLKLFLSCIHHKYFSKTYFIAYMHAGPSISLLRKVLLSIVCNLFGFPVVIHYHSASFANYTSGIKKILLSYSLKLASRRFVLTPWWKSFFQNSFPEYSFDVIPNPITSQIMKEALSIPKFSNNVAKYTIITMTRLEHGKGVEEVIKALNHLPDNYSLIIVGDGSQKKQLIVKTDELALNHRVSFLGWLNNEDKFKALHSSDVFCLPSLYDSFGMVFVEAFACGLPVVARKNEAIMSIISNNANNYVWDCDCIKKLAKLIEKAALERDINALERKKFVIDSFSPEVISVRINKIFSTL